MNAGEQQPASLEAVVTSVLAPLVAADGGTIEWLGRDGDTVQIKLGGSCAGCPGQPFTVRAVVLAALRAVDPTIARVSVTTAVGS